MKPAMFLAFIMLVAAVHAQAPPGNDTYVPTLEPAPPPQNVDDTPVPLQPAPPPSEQANQAGSGSTINENITYAQPQEFNFMNLLVVVIALVITIILGAWYYRKKKQPKIELRDRIASQPTNQNS